MEKNFAFVVASEENGYTVENFKCNSLEEAKARLVQEVEELGEEVVDDDFYDGEDEEGYHVLFGAFDLNSSLYSDWLRLVNDYATDLEESYND